MSRKVFFEPWCLLLVSARLVAFLVAAFDPDQMYGLALAATFCSKTMYLFKCYYSLNTILKRIRKWPKETSAIYMMFSTHLSIFSLLLCKALESTKLSSQIGRWEFSKVRIHATLHLERLIRPKKCLKWFTSTMTLRSREFLLHQKLDFVGYFCMATLRVLEVPCASSNEKSAARGLVIGFQKLPKTFCDQFLFWSFWQICMISV